MVTILDHPIIKHKSTIMRKKDTSFKEFREIANELATVMCYEAFRDLPLEEIEIETPVAKTKAHRISGKKMVIVPILRAGLGMLDGILNVFPSATVGHIGMSRDEETAEPIEYYCKLPSDIEHRLVVLIDPMLATGGSAIDAIDRIKEYGGKKIKFLCLFAAPEGVKAIETAHPDVEVYCANLDECLNEKKYIVPGVGDAGDRIFGTLDN